MERLSITSFLKHQHEYHLYAYEDVQRLPDGVQIKDGNEILPASMIFQYREFKSYAGFSNFFRYKLLMEKGGWWADTDMICLQPFDFADDYVFATEMWEEGEMTTSGAIKSPAGSDAMSYAWEVCQQKDIESLAWGETGPELVGEVVRRFSLEEFKRPPHVFCPISYSEWHRVLQPGAVQSFDQTTWGFICGMKCGGVRDWIRTRSFTRTVCLKSSRKILPQPQ